MIYIDPPYNTGNDFIYKDNFAQSEQATAIAEGDIGEEGRRLVVNQRSSGRFHSNWLTMMYARLRTARDLLSEDGVIFISIDENEVSNLRLILDEIYDGYHFVGQFVWQSKKGGGGDVSNVVIDHQYVICYAKNIDSEPVSKIPMDAEPLNLTDEKGPYRKGRELNKWGSNSSRQDRPTMYYPIPGPSGEEVYPIRNDGSEGCWRWGKAKLLELVAQGDALFEKREDGTFIVYEKIRTTDARLKPYRTWLSEVGTNAEGTEALKSIFQTSPFDFPKPLSLLEHLIRIGCTSPDDIVLDFFSGSGTTAHAVMNLNAEDGGRRKFIMVQLPEPIAEESDSFKEGFRTICDIGQERIRRAGSRIAEANGDKEHIGELDTGFKVFRAADTNIRWFSEAMRNDIFDIDMTMSDKDMLDFNPGFTDPDVVYEIMLRHRGIPLTTAVEQLQGIGPRTYRFAETVVVCLEESMTDAVIDGIAAAEPMPTKIILRDSAFGEDISLKENTMLRLEVQIRRQGGAAKRAYRVEFI
nr:site-specific DNA-methyltransferase [Paenibacillus oenotherae]